MEHEVECQQDRSMPCYEHLFTQQIFSASSETEVRAQSKAPGGGDSGKRFSSKKAPGGKDARQQKDGG